MTDNDFHRFVLRNWAIFSFKLLLERFVHDHPGVAKILPNKLPFDYVVSHLDTRAKKISQAERELGVMMIMMDLIELGELVYDDGFLSVPENQISIIHID